jgi:hypothetical protein
VGRRPARRRPLPNVSEGDFVSDLNREVARARGRTTRRVPSRTTSAGRPSTLRLSDGEPPPSRQIAPSTAADRSTNGETERATEPLVIVRAYDPVSDLEQRLSRIYALLSLPPTDTAGDHPSL